MNTTPSSRRMRLSHLSLLVAGITLASALHAQEVRHAVSLPPQPLDQALNALAGQTGPASCSPPTAPRACRRPA